MQIGKQKDTPLSGFEKNSVPMFLFLANLSFGAVYHTLSLPLEMYNRWVLACREELRALCGIKPIEVFPYPLDLGKRPYSEQKALGLDELTLELKAHQPNSTILPRLFPPTKKVIRFEL